MKKIKIGSEYREIKNPIGSLLSGVIGMTNMMSGDSNRPKNWRVSLDNIKIGKKEYEVSTVDLTGTPFKDFDNSLGITEKYETMVFDRKSTSPSHDLYVRRYNNRKEALKNHQEICKNLKKYL